MLKIVMSEKTGERSCHSEYFGLVTILQVWVCYFQNIRPVKHEYSQHFSENFYSAKKVDRNLEMKSGSKSNYTLQAVGFLNSFYTFFIFLLSCVSVVFMGVTYLVVNFVRDAWVTFLEKRFPDLEFVRKTTIRSALDTHRNMGIITLLVTVKGNCDPLTIKRRLLEDILEKRQYDGRYTYRHLRMTLTTRWGWYAWQKLVPFNIDNHLIFANPYYRGRPISDINIQEYISETVSKYLVPDLPPWQITVFQHLGIEKYYLLIRFHHMLLSNEGLDLGDLLMLSKNKNEISAGTSEENVVLPYRNTKRSHPFQELYKTPKALPLLFDQIYEAFSNNWNEFLSSYDPIENPSVLKSPGLTVMLAALLIITISVLKQAINLMSFSRVMVQKEFRQRGINLSLILWSMWNTLNPLSLIINSVKISFNITVFILIKLPLFLACECRSLCMIHDEKYLDASYIKTILAVWLVVKDSLKEALYYWKMIYNGPRIILEELLMADKHSRHQLQFMSLCGRKVVSWSDALPLEKLHEIQDVTGASLSEILISATSASMRDFLIQYSLDIPDSVLTTARYFPQEELVQSKRRRIMPSCGSGILCLPLPIRNPFGVEHDPVTELRAVQQIILRARLRQPALYLASLSQLQYGILTQVLPSPILRLVLNLLSRRFPVTLTEIAPTETGEFKKRYLWGQEVEDMMYWSSPQANVCMSLTLVTFGDYVRLGVMADALLSPHHTVITSTFAQHFWDLAAASGVTTNLRNYSFISDDSDTPLASQSSHNTTLSSSSLDFDLDKGNFSDEDNNINAEEPFQKYPSSKKLKFNLPESGQLEY